MVKMKSQQNLTNKGIMPPYDMIILNPSNLQSVVFDAITLMTKLYHLSITSQNAKNPLFKGVFKDWRSLVNAFLNKGITFGFSLQHIQTVFSKTNTGLLFIT